MKTKRSGYRCAAACYSTQCLVTSAGATGELHQINFVLYFDTAQLFVLPSNRCTDADGLVGPSVSVKVSTVFERRANAVFLTEAKHQRTRADLNC